MDEMEIMNMKASLADGLIGIHKVITRGFTITRNTLQNIEKQTPSDPHPFNGFLDYLRSFVTLIHSHHSAEDKIVFPIFRNKAMEAPYGLLAKGHVKMETMINQIKPLIETLAENKQDTVTIKKVQILIQEFNDLWDPHIQIEECRFSENTMGTHISIQEQQQIAMEIGQHMAKTANPNYLVIPFVFYNLTESDRKLMQPFLPPNIISLLTTWKDHWAPMQPFLLD